MVKAEYLSLVKLHQHPKSELFQVANDHQHRNRFIDVLPNEPTRFKITGDPEFYFNANWVLNKRAIACQGPKENEIDEFWKMVWHSDVKTLVMLTNPIEHGINKCSEYWKTGSFFGFRWTRNAEIYVKSVSEEEVFNNGQQKIIKRTIKIVRGNQEKTIVQYHLQNWPDHGVVSPEVLSEFVKKVSKEKGKLLAHCSAGVGRTGTFLTAYEAYRTKKKEIFSIVSDLRNPQKGRVGMIQSADQYALAYQTAQLR